MPGFVSARFGKGVVVINKEISKEEEEEGIVRDLIRRIQFMRKIMSLNVNDYIKISIEVPDPERAEIIRKWSNYIQEETRAKEIVIGEAKGDVVQEWEIEDEVYIVGISKVI